MCRLAPFLGLLAVSAAAQNTAGTVTTVIGGFVGDGRAANRANFNINYGLAVHPDGSMLVADTYNHLVRRIAPNGIVSTLAGNGTSGLSGDGGLASATSLSFPNSVAYAADGSVLISEGGTHRIRRVAPNGTISTFAGTGIGAFSGDGGPAVRAQILSPTGVAVSPDGSVLIADSGNHRIRRVSADGTMSTVAGTGTGGFNGDGISAVSAQLSSPNGIAVAKDGAFLIGDSGNHRIRKVAPNGSISTVAGVGTFGFTGDRGSATSANLNYPRGVAIDADGVILIADSGNHRVRRVSENGIITTVAGTRTYGFTGDGDLAIEAKLNYPVGVARATDGAVLIADTYNHRIRRVGADGVISTFAGTRSSATGGDEGLSLEASLNYPYTAVVAADGAVIVADTHNHRIVRAAPNGTFSTVAGDGTGWYAGDGGPARTAQLDYPHGVAIAQDGSILIADTDNNRIRRVDSRGIITTIAGTGTKGYGGDGGPAVLANLSGPLSISVARDGAILIADTGNHRIRRLGADGVITTVVGTGAVGSGGDGGPAINASLNAPRGVAAGADGSILIADTSNEKVRRVDPNGVITTLAGTGTSGFSGDGGQAVDARLSFPHGVASAPDGSALIADTYNGRIRRVSTTGVITTVAGSGFLGFSGDGGSATNASLQFPRTAALARDGAILFADTDNGRVRRVTYTPIDTPTGPSPFVISASQINFLSLTQPVAVLENEKQVLVSTLSANSALTFNARAATSNGPAGWLQVSPEAGSTPTILIVRANVSGLAPGNYTGTVTITSAAGAAQRISVALAIGAVSATRVTVNSFPAGRNLVVDGTEFTTPRNFDWMSGSAHTIDAPSPQSIGATRFAFDRWSHGGAKSQTISAPATATTYTAYFFSQHQLSTAVAPVNGGSVTVSPDSADGFYTEGARVQINAVAATNFNFVNFTGDAAGSANPQTVTIAAPRTITANFAPTQTTTRVTLTSTPPGRTVVVDGSSIITPRDFEWASGSNHSIDVASLQGSGSSRWVFSRWSQGGDRSQAVTAPTTATTFVAQFNTLHLLAESASPADGGTITLSPPSADGFYDEGTQVQVAAAPARGFSFTGFSGDVTGDANPQTVSVTGPRIVRAGFAAVQPLTVTPQRLDLTASQGAAATAQLRVEGPSSQPISFSANQPWLRVNPSEGTPPLTVSVIAVSTDLDPNSYAGGILIGGVNSVPVNFRVTPPVEAPRLTADVLPGGLRFDMFVGAPPPRAQTVPVSSSTGAVLNFTVSAIAPGGAGANWVDLSSRTGQTPGSVNIGIRVDRLSSPGKYTAQVVFQADGAPDVKVPVTLDYQISQPSSLEVDVREVKLSSVGEPQKQPLILRNAGTGVQPFKVTFTTDDGGSWLNVTPGAGSAVDVQPAMLQVTADPSGLSSNTYTGRILIEIEGQAPISLPVVFAVSAAGNSRMLRAAENGLSWRVKRGMALQTQALELIASGGAVRWDAKSGVPWIRLSPSTGQTVPGTVGAVQMDFDFNQAPEGVSKGTITLDSDSAGGTITVPVELQMLPASVPLFRASVTGLAFVAPSLASRELAFIASGFGRISMSSTKPSWLKAEEVGESGLFSGPAHKIRISIDARGIPAGEEENRGLITIQDVSGAGLNISVLVYVPVGIVTGSSTSASTMSAGRTAAAACTPSKFIPLFTSVLPNFEQAGGAATSTEIVMIDDCGNPVTSGVVGGIMSNRDPQLDLKSMGDGRWKASWSPASTSPLVALNVFGSDPDNRIGISSPARALTSIVSAATGPVLATDQPLETEAGVRLSALSPSMRLRIRGQNFLAADGSWPTVLIGGRTANVVDATATRLVVTTPADLNSNVEMQLVVLSGTAASTPEPVIVAPSWPSLASAIEEDGTVLVTGANGKVRADGVHILAVEPAGAGLTRLTVKSDGWRRVVRTLPDVPVREVR